MSKGDYSRPPEKKVEETREELLYRLLVQTLIHLEMRAEHDPSVALREMVSKETLAWWRQEKADERSEIVRQNKLRQEQRRIAAIQAKLTPEERELLKEQVIQETVDEFREKQDA